MRSLLKADLYRVLKSKLTLIMLILCIVFPLLMALLYLGIDKLNIASTGIDINLFSGKTMVTSAFSLTNNVGLIIPIFSCIYVCLDISQGTLRNKIIVGKSRNSIYFSHLLTSIIFNLSSIIIYFLFTFAFGMIFLGWGTEFNAEETKNLLYIIITGLMTFVYVGTVSMMFAMIIKSVAPAIILTVGLTLGINIVITVLNFINYEKVKYLVYMIPTFSNNYNSVLMALVQGVMPDEIFYLGIASYVLFGTLNTVIGLIIFNRSDIK